MSAEVKHIWSCWNNLTWFAPEKIPIQVFELTPMERVKLLEWIEKFRG